MRVASKFALDAAVGVARRATPLTSNQLPDERGCQMNSIELFAGAGGLGIGASLAGFTCAGGGT